MVSATLLGSVRAGARILFSTEIWAGKGWQKIDETCFGFAVA